VAITICTQNELFIDTKFLLKKTLETLNEIFLKLLTMRDFRLPLWYKREKHFFGILCSAEWQFRADVSEQPIRPVFKGRAVQD
jgi:hypothetical protein